MKQRLVLVTGGAGFIGSHLCKRLVREGYQVISLDNYFTGSEENHIPGVEYRVGHTKDVESLVTEKPDFIYHLGEYSRVAKSLEEPEVVFDLNMEGTFGVLNFWKKNGGKLIYAGSSTKFVDSRADGVTGRELSPYTWGKAVNSELIHNFGRWYQLPYSIAYFYNVYGPGERAGVDAYGTVIGTFLNNAQEGNPLEVRSPGTQRRAYTHVEDTVDALVRIGEKGGAEEYPISAAEGYSLLEVAAMVGGEISMIPATASTRSSEPEDTSKIQALGWKQSHTLDAYIREVMGA